MARPSSYKPEYASQAAKLCELGATDIELADFFGVDVRTFYRWMAEFDEFCQAVKTSKKVADERVQRSLYERATGYERDEVDIRVIGNQVVQTPVRKFYPPDTTACIFWLKNRDKENWRDKVEQEVTSNVTITNAADLTDEQLADIAAGSSARAASKAKGTPKPN